jgi:hypothetical protein
MSTLGRSLLILQVVVFAGAALMHAGILLYGHQHNAARNAESIIALVLLVGLVSTILAPESSRAIALGIQAFALLGTIVGLFTIAVGIGPRTTIDLMLHGGMIVLLVTGLIVVGRQRFVSASRST